MEGRGNGLHQMVWGGRGDLVRGHLALRKLSIACLILLPILFWSLLRFVFVSPEERIRRVVSRLAEAVEEEDVQRALGYVSEEYRDERGLDRAELSELVQETFETFEDLKVLTSGLKVEAARDTGRASLSVSVLGKFEGDLVFVWGSFNQPIEAKALFRNEGGEWRLVETGER